MPFIIEEPDGPNPAAVRLAQLRIALYCIQHRRGAVGPNDLADTLEAVSEALGEIARALASGDTR